MAFVSCSSGDFKVHEVANEDTGTIEDTSTDVPTTDPCADIAGATKVCITVKADSAHPGYDSGGSRAGELGLDGKGKVWVGLYDKNPIVPDGPAPAPVAMLKPAETGEISLSKLPLMLSGSVPKAGSYWVMAQFMDNVAVSRSPGPDAILIGDFASLPVLDSATRAASYLKLNVDAGKTAKLTLDMKPYFGVRATTTAGSKLHDMALLNKAIHGDGPFLFLVFDGDLGTASGVLLSIDIVSKCTALHPEAFDLPKVPVVFRTPVNGKHKLLGIQVDYDGWSDSGGNPFPGRGALLGAAKDGTVDISTSSWLSEVEVVFDDVNKPYTVAAGGTDKYVCP